MSTIQVRVLDQVLSAVVVPEIACNSQNVVRLGVQFDTSWNGYAKTAAFYTDWNKCPYEKVLSTDNLCIIPPEVLIRTGYLYIGIKGVKDGETKTTTILRYKVVAGTPVTVISDPTDDVYHQLLLENKNTNDALAVERARINNLASLKNGSTTGDAELSDIRVSILGETHENAGDAVRSQAEMLFKGLTSKGINECLKIRRAYYYLGSSSLSDALDNCKMRSSLVNLFDYQGAYASLGVSGSPYAVACELNSPLPVGTDFASFALIVNTDYEGTVALRFSSGLSWAATETTAGVYTQLKKGVNVIPLDTMTVNSTGKGYFNYVSLQTEGLIKATRLDAYVLTDVSVIDYLLGEIDSLRHDLVYTSLDAENFETYVKNTECTATYADSLLSIHIPEKTTEEAEWRYAIVAYNLGKDLAGRKLLVRRNTNNMRSFGIGLSSARWAEKNFATDHDIHEIDLEEFISDNANLTANTGDYFLVVGIETANTRTYTREYNESVNVMEITGAKNSIAPWARLATFEPNNYVTKDELSGDYIVCWGDSLTAGAGWTERLASLSGMTVHNAGTGGENVRAITARQGADVIMLNDITIPATTDPVTLATYSQPFRTAFGHTATPLLQGGSSHVNPVRIGNIEGTLAWTGSSYNDTAGTWTFTRSVAGEETVIDRPTAIVTAFDREKNNPHLMVVFMGQNGGYDSDNDELVRMHRLMIEHAKAKHFVILGLSSGTASERAEYEATMKKAFGRYFVSLREYLSKYGLADAGLTATDEDTAAMALGKVPPQLLTDTVHYTSACKTVIGNMLYKKCCELCIFD